VQVLEDGHREGGRMGLLLDLDVGSLRFFKNGDEQERHYGAGSVTGPVSLPVLFNALGVALAA
jgi:hypothetical protein